MHRRWTVMFGMIAAWLVPAALACADGTAPQSAWPYNPISPDTFRGPGFYLSTGKIITCLLLFLLWVRTADWINQDLQYYKLRVHTWNPIVVASFALAFLLMWVIPYFFLGFMLMLIAYAAPLLTYVFYYRNPRVEDHQRVLTPEHLRYWSAGKLKFIGIRIEAEKPDSAHISGPIPVELCAIASDDDQVNQATALGARQLPGYSAVAQLLDDAHRRRASAILLQLGQAVGVRYMIDGVWHNLPAQPIDAGQQVTQVVAQLVHLGEPAPSGRWNGPFAFRTNDGQIDCDASFADAEGGSRWLIKFDLPPEATYESLQDLGVREKVGQAIIEQLQKSQGVMLFSALPAGGLTTSFDVALRQVDRFMRDFVSIEDETKPESEVVNVDRKTYNGAAGENPAKILPAVGRASPDVIVCRNLVDADSVKMLCEHAADGTLILGSIPAKDSAEALLRVLVMKVPPAVFGPVVNSVLHVRLIRKLCTDCREPYAPSAALLKKLGIPAGKIEHLYRKPQDPEGPVCSTCDGIGYHGRTGLFELLVVDDTVRQVLTGGKPQLDVLRKAARKAGMQSELENGILLVAQGITSVEELQRALKT